MDDTLITGDDQTGNKDPKQHLFKRFQTKDLTRLQYFLGIEGVQEWHFSKEI